MDVKIIISMTILMVLMSNFKVNNAQSHKSGYCPQRNTVYKCSPRCMSDFECSFGEKCCPNICGTTSCSSPSPVSTGGDGGYKGSYKNSGSKTDSYCNGVKCRPYEKCGIDRYTKRPACVSQ